MLHVSERWHTLPECEKKGYRDREEDGQTERELRDARRRARDCGPSGEHDLAEQVTDASRPIDVGDALRNGARCLVCATRPSIGGRVRAEEAGRIRERCVRPARHKREEVSREHVAARVLHVECDEVRVSRRAVRCRQVHGCNGGRACRYGAGEETEPDLCSSGSNRQDVRGPPLMAYPIPIPTTTRMSISR